MLHIGQPPASSKRIAVLPERRLADKEGELHTLSQWVQHEYVMLDDVKCEQLLGFHISKALPLQFRKLFLLAQAAFLRK